MFESALFYTLLCGKVNFLTVKTAASAKLKLIGVFWFHVRSQVEHLEIAFPISASFALIEISSNIPTSELYSQSQRDKLIERDLFAIGNCFCLPEKRARHFRTYNGHSSSATVSRNSRGVTNFTPSLHAAGKSFLLNVIS
jgi:hypothetical protein